jgi:hypothetical protein
LESFEMASVQHFFYAFRLRLKATPDK